MKCVCVLVYFRLSVTVTAVHSLPVMDKLPTNQPYPFS